MDTNCQKKNQRLVSDLCPLSLCKHLVAICVTNHLVRSEPPPLRNRSPRKPFCVTWPYEITGQGKPRGQWPAAPASRFATLQVCSLHLAVDSRFVFYKTKCTVRIQQSHSELFSLLRDYTIWHQRRNWDNPGFLFLSRSLIPRCCQMANSLCYQRTSPIDHLCLKEGPVPLSSWKPIGSRFLEFGFRKIWSAARRQMVLR